jgi:hypothetical protein
MGQHEERKKLSVFVQMIDRIIKTCFKCSRNRGSYIYDL